MKSFLIKDFILLKQRKSFFMVYFLMIVAMIYTKNIVFFIDYFSILAMILAFSTMSYDSHDNGMVFLMTMPNARKNYARAKYALCGILLLASWVVPYLVKVVSAEYVGLPAALWSQPRDLRSFPQCGQRSARCPWSSG